MRSLPLLNILSFLLTLCGAFHDIFPRFSVFIFCRKLARMKNQQGTDKAREHEGQTVFLRDLVFITHQQKCHQLCFILHPIFILLLHNLCQITYYPRSTGRDTYTVSTNTITCTFCWGVHLSHQQFRQLRSCIQYSWAGPLTLLAVAQRETETETLLRYDSFRYAKVGHHCKFIIPHLL